MVTKAERDLDEELGKSPWPIYEDEDEPWKDKKRLLKLEERFDFVYEIAHVLGTTTSTVSYWLNKAREDQDVHLERGDNVICNECGGETPLFETICPECLNELRTRDREANYDNYDEYLREQNGGEAEA